MAWWLPHRIGCQLAPMVLDCYSPRRAFPALLLHAWVFFSACHLYAWLSGASIMALGFFLALDAFWASRRNVPGHVRLAGDMVHYACSRGPCFWARPYW